MTQNIPLGVLLVILGSFCFASSAHLQHHAVGDQLDGNVDKERMSLRSLLAAVRRPRWVLGLLLMGVSAALQITALTMAPVSVVQPVGLLAFPWSVLLAARATRTPVPASMQAAVAVTVVSTLAFSLVTGLSAAPDTTLELDRVVIGAVVVYACAVAFATLGGRGPQQWRCLFWSSGGALFYGLEAALVKSLLEFARTHDWIASVGFWGIGVALVVGAVTAGWLVQQGYATGPSEIVVGSMTVTSPVVAVAYGIAVLGEGTNTTPGAALLMGVLGALAVGGVVSLTRFHPDHRRV